MKLSEEQAALLAIIPAGRDVTSTELIRLRYPRAAQRPFDARGIINAQMRVLARKLEAMGDGRRIVKSSRRGPRPGTFRLEVTP